MLTVFAALLVTAMIELWVALWVADHVGVALTVVALVAVSALGVLLVRRQGRDVWRRAQDDLRAGRDPARPVVDGAMVLFGGVLLVVPGFVTGLVGLLLLVPPLRSLLRPALLSWMTARATRSMRRARVGGFYVGTVVDRDGTIRHRSARFGDVIDADSDETSPGATELPPAP